MAGKKDKSLIYWSMNYAGKKRRTMQMLPLCIILAIIFPVHSLIRYDSLMPGALFSVALMVVWVLQYLYTAKKAADEARAQSQMQTAQQPFPNAAGAAPQGGYAQQAPYAPQATYVPQQYAAQPTQAPYAQQPYAPQAAQNSYGQQPAQAPYAQQPYAPQQYVPAHQTQPVQQAPYIPPNQSAPQQPRQS